MEQATQDITAKDVIARLSKTDRNIDTLIDMAEEMLHTGLEKYLTYDWSCFTAYPGKGNEEQLDYWLSAPWDPYGADGIKWTQVDWDGTDRDGRHTTVGFIPDDTIPADDAVVIWAYDSGCIEVVSRKKIRRTAWERRADIITDYAEAWDGESLESVRFDLNEA